MKKILALILVASSFSISFAQTPTIENYITWSNSQCKKASDALEYARSELSKFSNCTSESCRTSALVMAEAAVESAYYSIEGAYEFFIQAENLARKKCSNTSMLFSKAKENLGSAKHFLQRGDSKLLNALESQSLAYQKEQLRLANSAIWGSLGVVDNIKAFEAELNKTINEIMRCQ